MGGKIVVKCKACGAIMMASRANRMAQRKVSHKKDCHPGFEIVENTLGNNDRE